MLWFMNTLVKVHVDHEEGGDGLALLESLAPEGDSPPLHVHLNEDELFHVLEGELRVVVGDSEGRATAGQSLLAPKGVPHTYRVESKQARWLVTTAKGDFCRFVRSFSRPAERDELPEPSPSPTPAEADALASACREHGIELVGPPLG